MSLFDGYEVHQQIRSMIKIYPDFVRLYKYAEAIDVRRFDYGEYNRQPLKNSKRLLSREEQEANEKFSLRRAKTRLTDITICNAFDMFATFTFDPKKVDRQDPDKCKAKMANWLHNQRDRHGLFKYIIVPEFHADKRSIHFHALFSGYKGSLTDKGRRNKKSGKVLYNIDEYKSGRIHSVEMIDDLEKVSSYVSKYITKSMPMFRNKQRYWCTSKLKRPLKIINPLMNKSDEAKFTSVYKDSGMEMFDMRGELPKWDIWRLTGYSYPGEIPRDDDLTVSER